MTVCPLIPVHDAEADGNFGLVQAHMRQKYRHMGTIVKNLPTTDSTKVFRSAAQQNHSHQLFFPWLGLSASEFGIGKVMCSLYHASSTGSVLTRQEKAERIREKRKAERQHKEAHRRLQRAVEEASRETNVVPSVLVQSAPPLRAAPVRRSRRLAALETQAR